MRRLSIAVIAAASTVALMQIASAADLPRKAPPPVVAPVFSWNGCYAGVNGGWIGNRSGYNLAPSGSYLNPIGGTAPPNLAGTGDFASSITGLNSFYDSDNSGGVVGGQVGCNYQPSGPVVLGIEADGQWSSLKNSFDSNIAAYPDPGNGAFTIAARTEQLSSELEWFATLRGRIGLAFDRLLIYGTGGLAIGQIKSQTNVSFATFPVSPVYNGAIHIGSSSSTEVGWVLGAGAEYAFATNWSVKAEYLHIEFGTQSYLSPLSAAAAPAAVGPGYSWGTTVHPRYNIARVGLNYKFY